MSKEEVALNLTIASMNKMSLPSNNDDFYATVCSIYNSIYDNIVVNH